MVDVLLESVDEHARDHGPLRHGGGGGAGGGRAVPEVDGVQVGHDGGGVRGVGRPVRVGLQHPLHRSVVPRLSQQLQAHRCLALPFGP